MLATVALVGCGSDYYYLAGLDVDGDTLIATFAFTCPGVRLAWDGSFREWRADLSVETAGDGCDDRVNATFDLRPMKRAYVEKQRDPIDSIDLRVPGHDELQKPKCATYLFSTRDLEEPGWGDGSECF